MSPVSIYALQNLNNKVSKIILLVLLLLIIFILKTPLANAQTYPNTSGNNQQFSTQVSNPNLATKALYDFGHALSCLLIGSSPLSPCLEYKFTKNLQGAVSATPYLSSVNTSGGLLGMGGSAIALMYQQKPVDQISFFSYLGQNLGIVDKAHAQVGGSGNQVLSPIFALWTVSRNVAYLAMILIFIGVGVMVMFRQKLNPQTVVTAQMALPGLVIGLIMITFSYFIASLITDMAYVGTDLVGYYFNEAIKVSGATPATQPLTERLSNENPLSVGGGATGVLDSASIRYFIDQGLRNLPWTQETWTQTLVTNPASLVRLFAGGLTYMLYNSFLSPLGDAIGGGFSLASGVLRWRAGGAITAGAGTSALGALIGGTPTLAAAGAGLAAYADPSTWLAFWASILAVIILLYSIVRLALRLINNYLMIIFLTITSPFVFLISSLPGRSGMASDWVKNMLCNVLSFPAVIAVFYFAAYLLGQNPQIPGFGVNAAFNITDANANLPFLGGLDLEHLRRIIAFVAILATPSIPDIVCKTIGKPGAAGGAFAGAVSGAISGGRSYEGQLSGQIQKTGNDVGSWRTSLFGTKSLQAGRAGDLQVAMTRMAGYDPLTEGQQVGAAHPGGFWGRLSRIAENTRSTMPTRVPLSGSKVAQQSKVQGPFGG